MNPETSSAEAPAGPAAAQPTHIGEYQVVRKLGEGATSEVFLCRDGFHERDVAVKRVLPSALRDPVDGRYYSRFFAAEAWAGCTIRTWCSSMTPWRAPTSPTW
jgi:eukaryotic-like serine/threonine-protein kinase